MLRSRRGRQGWAGAIQAKHSRGDYTNTTQHNTGFVFVVAGQQQLMAGRARVAFGKAPCLAARAIGFGHITTPLDQLELAFRHGVAVAHPMEAGEPNRIVLGVGRRRPGTNRA